MGLQKKIGVLIIGVHLLIPSFAYSLVLEPLKIDSSRGEPLYAEIPFRNAQSQSPIKVSIAQPFELGQVSVLDPEKFAHLNFYVRQNAQGNGVIVITSSRAITESAIDLTLKIEDSGQVRMQNMNTKLPSRIERLQNNLKDTELKPRFIANEKDIQLNLPVSSTIINQPTVTRGEQQLVLQSSAPPPLIAKSNTSGLNAQTGRSEQKSVTAASQISPQAIINTNQITTTASTIASPISDPHTTVNTTTIDAAKSNLTINVTRRIATAPIPATNNVIQQQNISTKEEMPPIQKINSATPQAIKTIPPAIQRTENNPKHVVKVNETLWGIAQQIATAENISTQQVMHQIQQSNQHAFIGGNANRLKQGAILNLPTSYQSVPSKQQTNTQADANKVTQTINAQKATKQTQAHMSIVGKTNQGTAQGSQEKITGSNKVQNELTIELKNQRGSTLELQNNVKKLDQQLREKERRIALLNTRLAELEQQLKNKKVTSQSNSSNTTSKNQGVIPALITGTIIAFSSLNADLAITTLLQELI